MTARLNPLAMAATAALLIPNALSGAEWRSTLYPADWKPGFADAQGHTLQDFSYAGYHRGEADIPQRTGEVIDVTKAPYLADASGKTNATAAIQGALDAAAAKSDGAIVYLPAGAYRIAPPEGQKVALRVEGDNLVLRGAGADKTFLFNDSFQMREKIVLEVSAKSPAWWFSDKGVKAAAATRDLASGSTVLPIADSKIFAIGDQVIVRNDPTENFIAALGMTGKWTTENLKNRGLVFCRRITAVDVANGTVTIDVPTRYELKQSDNARVLKLPGKQITEVGLEDFSIGMVQHPDGPGWGEEDYGKEGTAAYDVHQSHAIVFTSAENCWMRRVHSYAPEGNSPDVHFLSNGVKFERSRLCTFIDCDFRHTQYKGGGGNGYLYTLHGNDCLIRDSRAEDGRHNFDFGTMAATGNVIYHCTGKDGRLASDYHMYFSVSNLIDNHTCDGDFLEAKYRPYGGSVVHGVTTSESVYWNTNGLNYIKSPFEFEGKLHDRPQLLIESAQFGHGYVIGTRGPANKVKTTDNFQEGIGQGDTLVPPSLYLDQLARRLKK